MAAIACRLLYHSISAHLQQLYTGFAMLHRSGFLRLTQQRRASACRYENDAPHLRQAGHAHLDVLLAGRLRLHFDTHDSREIALGELRDCDLYLKRSYSPATVAELPAGERPKVWPLGLNYRVLPDSADLLAMRRGLMLHGFSHTGLAAIKQALDAGNRFGFQPRLSYMEAPPRPEAAANVLFLVAAYDPYDDPARTREKIEDRICINETRARCLRLLREALGSRFLGGFSRSRFTLQHYGDLVVPAGMTSQESYLRIVRGHSICIASTGLHGSIGWKLAEYVALSKAVLSEPLLYEVPGDFAPGRNYLEFTSPEECLNGAVRLIEDSALRTELMRNNAAYYQAYGRPDVLVRNALTRALELRPQ